MKTGWNNGGSVLVRVGPHHFAFLRGYFEGLSLATLSRRYLETAISPDPDLRIARSTLRWIREQLMVAARRRGLFAEARLILLDPEKLRGSEKRAIPTLEEFREIRDPHELFSEAELLELFHDEYGNNAHSDRRTARNERLRRKQINALLALEKLLGSPPSPSDDVTGWLHPVLSKRLKTAGLTTLAQLVDAINARGYRWWTRIPRFGEKAAAQVVAWLSTESTSGGLGMKLGIQATIPARKIPTNGFAASRPKQFGMMPLEFLILPPHLDGSDDQNRGPDARSLAANDLDAIHRWLETKQDGSHTWRSYRKEAERLLLWAILERGKSLSSLSSSDCRDYLEFLNNLGSDDAASWRFRLPRTDWIAPRGTKRWSPLWRPFEGRLSVESRRLTVRILALMGRWFVDRGYWRTHPWEAPLDPPPPRGTSPKPGFSDAEWLVLSRYLELIEDRPEVHRLRFLLILFRKSGLRVTELADARREDLRLATSSLEDGGFLKIRSGIRMGKELAVDGELLIALDHYLIHRGRGGIMSCPPSTSLVGRLSSDSDLKGNGDHISTAGLYFVLKEFFFDVARWIDSSSTFSEPLLADVNSSVFRKANTRWLRSEMATGRNRIDG